MCSDVVFIYSCRHRESTILKCPICPDLAPHCPGEPTKTRTRLQELCHDCEFDVNPTSPPTNFSEVSSPASSQSGDREYAVYEVFRHDSELPTSAYLPSDSNALSPASSQSGDEELTDEDEDKDEDGRSQEGDNPPAFGADPAAGIPDPAATRAQLAEAQVALALINELYAEAQASWRVRMILARALERVVIETRTRELRSVVSEGDAREVQDAVEGDENWESMTVD